MSHSDTVMTWEIPDLPPTARLVLLCLAHHRNGTDGRCFPKQETIAKKTGYSVATVKRAIAELEARGIVRVTRRTEHGMKAVNQYTLHLTAPISTVHCEPSPMAHGEPKHSSPRAQGRLTVSPATAHTEPRIRKESVSNQEAAMSSAKPDDFDPIMSSSDVSEVHCADAVSNLVAPLPSSPSAPPPPSPRAASPAAPREPHNITQPDRDDACWLSASTWPRDANGDMWPAPPGSTGEVIEAYYGAKRCAPIEVQRPGARLVTSATLGQLRASSRKLFSEMTEAEVDATHAADRKLLDGFLCGVHIDGAAPA